jgi:hypothetical protein
MNATKKALLASAVVLGLGAGSVQAATGLQFQVAGNGNIAGSVLLQGIGGGNGSLLANDMLPVITGGDIPLTIDGFVYAQNSIVVQGLPGIFTWQAIIPVTATVDNASPPAGPGGDNEQVRYTNRAAASTWAMYWDTSPAVNSNLGNGYGTLNGAIGGGAGQTLILSGTVSISNATGFFEVSQNAAGTVGTLAVNRPDITTIDMTGSLDLAVDVTFQDTGFVVNDLVGASVDLIATSLGPKAPYATNVNANRSVVGVLADFGATPVNDFACGGGPACDLEMQISEAMTFNGEQVPEPMTLALLGAGLGLVGFASRKRGAA